MSEEEFLRLAIGLTSAFGGWLLAQMTSLLKTWIQRRKTVAMLYEELNDISKETDRLLIFYSRMLQIHGGDGVTNSGGAIGISSPIYKNYYKDGVLSLNQDQRISFQMIHGLVDHANKIIEEIDKLTNEIQKEFRENGLSEKIAKGGSHWGALARAGYSNCAIIKWRIDFHLKNRKKPEFEFKSKAHENYLKYLESVHQETEKTIASGKDIPKEKFNKIYNPEVFVK